jgi:hypothetical protein
MRLTRDASPAALEHSRFLRVGSAGRASPTCDESVTLCDDPAQNQARMCSAARQTASARPVRSYVVAMGVRSAPHRQVRPAGRAR